MSKAMGVFGLELGVGEYETEDKEIHFVPTIILSIRDVDGIERKVTFEGDTMTEKRGQCEHLLSMISQLFDDDTSYVEVHTDDSKIIN